ncbi:MULTISPECIES: Uma2 family endonuclease [Nocardia]|jgi:Uma2 family endonuclease|uniref:Uma2 family endonuclease n=1 Tax=Nocardia TaxID=1817 RepID=UPI001892F432|nr:MULTISPECIES: Uma2 family endonuclease [Nocardia]MBF6473896.1 Uma2 family endonuclease [Nocardia abscessus]MDE1671532.1 Uma2 family endonuclease [Nocardia gipuzkoensis]
MTSSAPSDWYRWIPDQITARDYELLPSDFCRTIEVVDGHIVKCESPSRLHNRVARRMAAHMEAARKPEPCLMVETDVDVRLSDVPLSLRRPDVVVYRCLDDDARLYADDTVLVVEIVSPDSSHHTDTVEKKAAYAAAGIPVYLIVFLTEPGDGIEQIEEYRLSEGRYHLVCLHTRRLTVDVPIPVDVAFGELATG